MRHAMRFSHLGSRLFDYPDWRIIGQNGLQRTYIDLFGDPSTHEQQRFYAFQPVMQLPSQNDLVIHRTAWRLGRRSVAALDFAPPGTELGCFESDSGSSAMASFIFR